MKIITSLRMRHYITRVGIFLISVALITGIGGCLPDEYEYTPMITASYHVVGLKSDGTVVSVGLNWWGECNINHWSRITQVAAGGYHTVGLNSYGTVVVTGSG